MCMHAYMYKIKNRKKKSKVGPLKIEIKLDYPVSLFQNKLEQLERLRSEIPPAAPWLPILVIHIRSQVKKKPSQSYKF